jgi:hypothetical protein
MDTHSIIKQFTEQTSDSPLEEEQISELLPINFIYDFYKYPFPGFKDQQTGEEHSIKWKAEKERLTEINRVNKLIKTHNDRENKRYTELTKGLSDDDIFEISRMPGNEDLYEEPNIINPIPLWSIYCTPILVRSAPDEALQYHNVNFLKIDDEELYKKLYCDIKDKDQSLLFINQLIFDFIIKQVSEAKKHEIWDEQSIWFNPYRKFHEWFQLNNIENDNNIHNTEQLITNHDPQPEKHLKKITKSNKQGGRPKDPDLPDKKNRLRKDYYRLTEKEGYKSIKAIKTLTKKYKWKKSTIETYLKK